MTRVPGLGPAAFARLLDRFGTGRAAISAGSSELRAAGLDEPTNRALCSPDWAGADRDLDWRERAGNEILMLGSSRYPARLAGVARPPPVLYVRGRAELLSDPQVAMVGSRNPTRGGRETARDFAAYLASAGMTVTSGLALGIDSESHRGALAGGGFTIAVLGTGPDRVYPAHNRTLAREILERGVLVTEFSPGTPAARENFPRRNRIIAGLALGTLVVEAAPQSGSLITARLAAEQGREVFAIPGSIHNPVARGCHALIRQGAKLVETGQHVLEELLPQLNLALIEPQPADCSPCSPDTDPDTRHLVEEMGFDPVSVDELVARTQLTPKAVSSMLLILELQGHVSCLAGGRYVRSTPRGHS